MTTVPSTVEQPPVAEDRPARSTDHARWLVIGCYLLGAVIVTSRLWVDPAARMQAGDSQDVNLFAWFLRYSATAISHGRLPALFTTALDAPRGVNMMWNTAFLLPGILLTPVTLLASPQVSLTIMLTVSIAGSAASLYWVLRRWGASVTGAALGGAVYGFSPAMLNSGIGHYQLVFAVLPPLIIHAVLRIVTGRGKPVTTGISLGLLVAAQLLTGEEMLIYTAVASAPCRAGHVTPSSARRPESPSPRRSAGTRCGCSSTARCASTPSCTALSPATRPFTSIRRAVCSSTRGPVPPWSPGSFSDCRKSLPTWAGR